MNSPFKNKFFCHFVRNNDSRHAEAQPKHLRTIANLRHYGDASHSFSMTTSLQGGNADKTIQTMNVAQQEGERIPHIVQNDNSSHAEAQPKHLRTIAKKQAKCAFSLVEAMIILMLISIAIMALIPLMLPHKNYIPRWKEVRDNAGGNVVAIAYGRGPDDMVGIAEDPYTRSAKLSVNSLSIKNQAPDDSIFWGDNYISGSYCTNTTAHCINANSDKLIKQTNSIQLGMNSCKTTTASTKLVIRSSESLGFDCNNADININDRIIQKDNTYFGISGSSLLKNDNSGDIDDTADLDFSVDNTQLPKAYIYIAPNANNQDKFRISADGDTPIMEYDGNNNLAITPSVTVNDNIDVSGDVILSTYSISTSDTDGNFNGTVGNLQCNLDPTANPVSCAYCSNDECKYTNSDGYTFMNTLTTGDILKHADIPPGPELEPEPEIQQPSDRRLKNILKEYTKGTGEILKVNTYVYTYKNDKNARTYVGVIAQKLIGIFDEALHKDAKGYYSYERTPLLYAMTNSVKEINSKQKQMSEKNNKLNKKADKLIRMYR